VVFALPYGEFSLVGTTDIPVDRPEDTTVSAQEVDYLCEAVNRYFALKTAPTDTVWSYAGVRSLHDDGAEDAKAVTRDYHLELDTDPGAKLLSVFGGKITTARALAEEALDRLGIEGPRRTAWNALPGGDVMPGFLDYLQRLGDVLPQPLVARLARAYGTRLGDVLGSATRLEDLGRHFGAGLYEAEVRYLREREFARTAEDILWRRTKLGLHMDAAEREALARYLA
jgi:glycerol-3-phosphate dehydrogenase